MKPKYRVPGQTFAETIGALIGFIEANPMVKAGELVKRFLGIELFSAEPAPEGEAAPVPAPLAIEQREKIARMQSDLLWLVREGYVTEFIDGGLYAPPPVVEARKQEIETEGNDPENYPIPESARPSSPAAGDGGSAAEGAPPSPETSSPVSPPEPESSEAPSPESPPAEPSPSENALDPTPPADA